MPKKYNTAKLKVAQKFTIELRNKFSCLAYEEVNISDNAQDVEKEWEKIKKTYQDTTEEVMGFQSRSSKPWISAESWIKIDERRELKR